MVFQSRLPSISIRILSVFVIVVIHFDFGMSDTPCVFNVNLISSQLCMRMVIVLLCSSAYQFARAHHAFSPSCLFSRLLIG